MMKCPKCGTLELVRLYYAPIDRETGDTDGSTNVYKDEFCLDCEVEAVYDSGAAQEGNTTSGQTIELLKQTKPKQ